jgi:hypothetical protein
MVDEIDEKEMKRICCIKTQKKIQQPENFF